MNVAHATLQISEIVFGDTVGDNVLNGIARLGGRLCPCDAECAKLSEGYGVERLHIAGSVVVAAHIEH